MPSDHTEQLEKRVALLESQMTALLRIQQKDLAWRFKNVLMKDVKSRFNVDPGSINIQKRDKLKGWEDRLLGSSKMPPEWKTAIRAVRKWDKQDMGNTIAHLFLQEVDKTSRRQALDTFVAQFADEDQEEVRIVAQCCLSVMEPLDGDETPPSDTPQPRQTNMDEEEMTTGNPANREVEGQEDDSAEPAESQEMTDEKQCKTAKSIKGRKEADDDAEGDKDENDNQSKETLKKEKRKLEKAKQKAKKRSRQNA